MDELSRREIDLFLAEELVGRIGCHAQGQTYVVPVIYAYDGEAFYAHSVEGLKLRMMRANPQVCFEVDHYYGSGNWTSVIARGAFEQLEGSAAERALTLLLDRFPPGSRSGREKTEGCPSSSFRILVGEISGRQMRRLNRRGRVQLWDGDRRLDDEFREVARRVERGGVSRAFDPTGARAGMAEASARTSRARLFGLRAP